MTAEPTSARALTFFDEVVANTPGGDSRLELCLQCGTCGGSCPSGADMEHTPREIFAMIDAGMKDEVLRSNAPWYCVSCYYCMTRCPQEIHITDIMYTLKRMAIREGLYKKSSASDAPGFSETFISFVENNGRSFELGLAAVHHLRYHPINAVKMATGMGLEMILKGRMAIVPTKIKGIKQLQSILNKAKELGGAA
ncbi:MAG: 4Fe-4S dicluster domain-containing protein [Chloroflexota bacterium]|nr:4Fe-4S dicluster domain-containing protein [Chloroflexota bacterium]